MTPDFLIGFGLCAALYVFWWGVYASGPEGEDDPLLIAANRLLMRLARLRRPGRGKR